MPQTNISSAIASGLNALQTSDASQSFWEVNKSYTDGAGDTKEFRYQQTKWGEYLGYYKSIPELKIAVDTKANWVMGNGFEADEITTLLLSSFRGNGKDTFNSILENMERTCYIAEDAYCEIIRDKEGILINLKPLDPSSIVVVANEKGKIIRYEQTSKTTKLNTIFKPEEIFVLSHNRIADEIHGNSIIPAVKWVIDARNEAMSDWKRVLHRNIDPLWIYHLDTDDVSEIAAFKTKNDTARANGENMYIPKGVVVPELVTTATNANLNPLAWIAQLNDYFFQAVGVPQIVVGNAKEFTDASGKIVYLAFEQRIKGRQEYVEEQVLLQLNVDIELNFPTSIQNETLSDVSRPDTPVQEEPIQQAAEPNNTTAELEGKT
jgi:hypothetical protein